MLGFGAGALIASVSFELAEEGLRIGSAYAVAAGLALGGARPSSSADRLVERWGGRSGGSSAGAPLAVGAFLDGIPEQAVLGIGIASGERRERRARGGDLRLQPPRGDRLGGRHARGAAAQAGRSLRLWAGVAACVRARDRRPATPSPTPSPATGQALIDGFAAGALLTMLIDSMVPEAKDKAKDLAGLATVAGFAIAAGLSLLGG